MFSNSIEFDGIKSRIVQLLPDTEKLHRVFVSQPFLNKRQPVSIYFLPATGVIPKRIHGTEFVRGLIVDREGVAVKIEPNLVLRGSVYPSEIKMLSKKAQDFFELSVQSRILLPYDLYAGKICAALDRQHPRNLFDVHLPLKNKGLKPEIRRAFIPYSNLHNNRVHFKSFRQIIRGIRPKLR